MIDLRALVWESLDSAKFTGHDPRNPRDAEYLAEDLCELDYQLASVEPITIVPFVQEWLNARGDVK